MTRSSRQWQASSRGCRPSHGSTPVLISRAGHHAVVLQWLAGDRLRFAFLFPMAIGLALFRRCISSGLLAPLPYAVLPGIFVTHHRIALAVAFGAGVVVLAVGAAGSEAPIRRFEGC